jgi:flagellar assembly factor FliW
MLKDILKKLQLKFQDKETVGVLNIVTLNSPDKEITTKIRQELISQCNRFAEITATISLILTINNAA